MGPLRNLLIRVLCLWLALAFVSEGRAQYAEYEVKATFLLTITKFTSWPDKAAADTRNPFTIGVLGDDPFGDTLDAIMRGQTVAGRKIAIKRSSKPDALDGCQILFISRSEASRVAEILKARRREGTLTVSDIDEFTKLGGMVGLSTGASKLRFHINVNEAQRARLNFSSRILTLSTAL
jgi:YfiR/HmsC-like